jgi:hypothetical protein
VTFIIVESVWRATSPPLTPTFSTKTANQNFETAILFNVVERTGIYVFEDDNSLKALKLRIVNFALGHIRFI